MVDRGLLPPTVTGLIGRKDAVAEIRRLQSQSCLVSVTGAGGVGKTSLARLVTWQVRRAFDKVLFIDSTDVASGSSLAGLIASAMGIVITPGGATAADLADHLADRSILLVLDTCEYLVDEACDLVHVLLRACPRLRILAASRARLGVAGEVTLVLPPLPVPADAPETARELAQVPSVFLFLRAMATRNAGFRLVPENRRPVADLCRQVDGLPLGLELAAALLADGSLELTDPMPPLSSWWDAPVPGPVARHRSLRACFEWSHRHCTPAQQLLWARLTVFEDAFEVDDVEALCSDASLPVEDMLDVLAALVDKSVLVRDECDRIVRFRMLRAVRAFGAERLSALGEQHDLRGRYVDWCRCLAADAAARLTDLTQAGWLARFDRRVPDIRAALADTLAEPGSDPVSLGNLVALLSYWALRGLPGEDLGWLERGLAHATGSPVVRAKARLAAAVLAAYRGDLERVRTLAVRAGQTSPADEDDDDLSAARERVAGLISLLERDPGAAADHLYRAAEIFRRRNDRVAQVAALAELTVAHALAGDLERTAAAHAQIRALVGDPERPDEVTSTFLVTSTWALGVALWRSGAQQEATATICQALRGAYRLHQGAGIAAAMEVLAWIAVEGAHAQRAAVLLGAVAGVARRTTTPTAFPGLLLDPQRCLDTVRRALGGRALGAALRRGEGLEVAAAVEFACREPDQIRPPTSASAIDASRCAEAGRPRLTGREREVADLIGQGLTNREIADRLVVALRTAEGHVESIMAKLGTTSRTQVALWLTMNDPSTGGQDRGSSPVPDL